MKIIDLLNKIANGEEVPNRFIYNGCLYENFQNGCYRHYDYAGKYGNITDFVTQLCDDFCNLNDEIEILNNLEEEKKIPEKLGYFDLTIDKNEKDENGDDLELHYTGVSDTFDDVYEKINEIIDCLTYLKSKGDE